jgi:hypothetical protein
MSSAEHAVRMGAKEMHAGFWWVNLKEEIIWKT